MVGVCLPSGDVAAVNTLPVAALQGMAAVYNPRKINDHDLAALRRSIRFFGAVEPVVVNTRTQRIVGGHQRVKAAAAEGIAEFPVVYVDLDEPAEKQLNLALNRISGQWDDEKLRALLIDLDAAGADLELTGFDDKELARLLQVTTEGLADPDAVPDDASVEKRCEVGDLWQLGRHRLVCGDATDPLVLARLWDPAARPVLCVTDPPYGVEYDPAWRAKLSDTGQMSDGARTGLVKNDDRADWSEVWAICDCDVIYAWCAAGDPQIQAGLALTKAKYQIRASIIWRKTNFPLSRGHYTFTHEPAWYAVKKDRTAHWIGDNNASTVWEVALDENVPGGHSTQKPVELFRKAIANHQGDVFEPFCGSGTCLIACEQLDRICYAVEIDPHYCDVILARWEAFSGCKAERLSDGKA